MIAVAGDAHAGAELSDIRAGSDYSADVTIAEGVPTLEPIFDRSHGLAHTLGAHPVDHFFYIAWPLACLRH